MYEIDLAILRPNARQSHTSCDILPYSYVLLRSCGIKSHCLVLVLYYISFQISLGKVGCGTILEILFSLFVCRNEQLPTT